MTGYPRRNKNNNKKKYTGTDCLLGYIFFQMLQSLNSTSKNVKVFLQPQTYSLLLLGGLLEMGYFGDGLLFGQDAASMAPPTTARKAPAQAMKMAEPNSYLVLTGVKGL